MDDTFVRASQYSLLCSTQESSEPLQSSEDMFASEDLLQTVPQSTQKEYQKRPLNDSGLTTQTLRRRVREQRNTISEWCSQQGCTIVEFAGLLIYLESYPINRETAKTGWNVFKGISQDATPKATILEAIWMMERLEISYTKYTDLRLMILDRFILPPVHLVAQNSKKMRPSLEVYHNGARASLADCLTLTVAEQLSLGSPLPDDDATIFFSFNYGLDGSGQHSDYAQLSKANYSTKQVMNVCFALSSIKRADGTIIWCSSSKGHNSPHNIRPLALFPEKESDDILKEFIPSLDQEVKEIKENGLQIILPNGKTLTAKVEKEAMTMCDGKMVVRLLQLGGSYCTMCHFSQSQCHDPAVISSGFKITRSVESIQQLALSLTDPDSEQIKKLPGDYAVRQGITGTPITTADVTKTLPVCHSKIQTFDWFVNSLLVKTNSTQKWHSSTTPIRYTEEEKKAEKEAREEVKREVKQKLGINIGDPSDMITGNCFKTFSSDESREILADLIKEESLRVPFKEIHLGLSAIIRVLNSQHHKINLSLYKDLCTSVHLKICEAFPWAIISPSIHRVLAHSWEKIELNDMTGLGSESEEALEAQNKFVRYLRVHGARKTSTEENFQDTRNHLWRRLSPLVTELDREKRKRRSKILVQNEVDTLVETLFEN